MGYFFSNLIVYAFIFSLVVLAYYAIRKIKNKDPLDLKLDDISKLKFKDFYINHQKYMRIKDYNDFLKYISN